MEGFWETKFRIEYKRISWLHRVNFLLTYHIVHFGYSILKERILVLLIVEAQILKARKKSIW